MKVVGLASDHAGFELKEYVKQWLKAKGWEYKDFGTYSTIRISLIRWRLPLKQVNVTRE